jgi:hypothetical protein
MNLTHIAPPEGALKASQVFDLFRKAGGGTILPQVKGWVQCATRELPRCRACGDRLEWDAALQIYSCPACNAKRGLFIPAVPVAPGEIVAQHSQHNDVLRTFWKYWFYYQYSPRNLSNACRIFLSNHNQPIHEMWSAFVATYADTCASSVLTASINYTGKYWTYSYTFAAPAAPGRTIRIVSLGVSNDQATSYTYCRYWHGLAATKLSSDIYQSNTQTFEVVYRLTFVEV